MNNWEERIEEKFKFIMRRIREMKKMVKESLGQLIAINVASLGREGRLRAKKHLTDVVVRRKN